MRTIEYSARRAGTAAGCRSGRLRGGPSRSLRRRRDNERWRGDRFVWRDGDFTLTFPDGTTI